MDTCRPIPTSSRGKVKSSALPYPAAVVLIILSCAWTPGLATRSSTLRSTTTATLGHGSTSHYHSGSTAFSVGDHRHKCYVCLPPDRSSRDAKDIMAAFPEEERKRIPQCSTFTPSREFEFNCPPGFKGCLLRIHGTHESRNCAKFSINDCKTANSVEFCTCTGPLCNDKKPVLSDSMDDSQEKDKELLEAEKDEQEARKFLRTTETDDEDLLAHHDQGSGSIPPDEYSTTPQVTLVPNRTPTTKPPLPPSRAVVSTVPSYYVIAVLIIAVTGIQWEVNQVS